MSSRVPDPEREYIQCQRCDLAESRRRIVFRGSGRVSRGTVERGGRLLYYRGEIQEGTERGLLPRSLGRVPRLLFIGEAPGRVEDVRGIPFTGEAGRIFNMCLSLCTTKFEFDITNVIACRPWTTSKYGNIINREPSPREIEECSPRVYSLISEIPYTGFVRLGKVALNIRVPHSADLQHPSSILRQEFKYHDIRKFSTRLDKYVNSYCIPRLTNQDGQ